MSKTYITASEKWFIIERANHCCEYCLSQLRFTNQSFSVEHIIPKSKGGESILDNLALSCQSCNNHKYTKTNGLDLISGETILLFHPRQDQWVDHFVWNEDCSLIIGVTPTGRVTVNELQLNKSGLINLRRILYEVGEHPPK